MNTSRRDFLKRSLAAGAAATVPYVWTTAYAKTRDLNSQATIAAIGVGGSRGRYSRGGEIAMQASNYGRMIAVCDVDDLHTAEFNAKFDAKLDRYRDYRELFDKEKPDIVTIGTPDHWHVPIAITALRAGCDVYCEKPLTLTIDEGILLRQAAQESGRVFQVGTQQRSEYESRFLKAIAIVQSGRLGKQVNAYVAVGGGEVGGPFEAETVPSNFDWDFWLGPANAADYSEQRRKEFRWYYDYSGGKMTDWGAHHIDIAQWALGCSRTGPVKVSGTGKFTPLVPDHFPWQDYLHGQATLPDGFHTATQFSIDLEYADGSIINISNEYSRDDGRTKFDNGILFEGEDGRIFVNRERLAGRPVEELTDADHLRLQERIIELYKGKRPGNHMSNFFECVESREEPISDVASHHRTMTSCHLCNIALMLGRDLHWDPDLEKFKGDEQATALATRPRRTKYSLEATT